MVCSFLTGFSFAFGAFVSGLVLSESDDGYQALSDLIPLHDLFGLLMHRSRPDGLEFNVASPSGKMYAFDPHFRKLSFVLHKPPGSLALLSD
jgi:hypothetical protein